MTTTTTTVRPLELIAGPLGVPGWLHEVEASVLRAAVQSTRGTIVETGTWAGRSLLTLAKARAEQGTTNSRPLLSVDPYPEAGQAEEAAASADDPAQKITPFEARELCHALIGRLGVKNVWWCNEPALTAAATFSRTARLIDDRMDTPMAVRWPKNAPPIDLLYLDDHHDGAYVVRELEAWLPYCAEEVEVCLHDFGHEPYGIERAIDRFLLRHDEWIAIDCRLSMFRMRRRWLPPARGVRARAAKVEACNEAGSPRITYTGNYNATIETPRPLVSVLYNTWRLGGFDCLRTGLDAQTLAPDLFEVVIVDALFPYRYEAVANYFKDAPYRVRHLNVTGNPFPRDHGNRARNEAIRAAVGDVCVWWCDHSIAQPESLERHLQTVLRGSGRVNSAGNIVYAEVALEALHPLLQAALPLRSIDDYVDLVEALPADSPLWTTSFCDSPRALGRRQLIVGQLSHALPYELRGRVLRPDGTASEMLARDQRRDHLNGPLGVAGFELYYAKNEATARQVLVDLNGWEEAFDDGHTNDDTDLGRRLAKAGICCVNDAGNQCFVPNMRPFYPLMRWARSPIENRALYCALRDLDRTRAVVGLVDERSQCMPRPSED